MQSAITLCPGEVRRRLRVHVHIHALTRLKRTYWVMVKTPRQKGSNDSFQWESTMRWVLAANMDRLYPENLILTGANGEGVEGGKQQLFSRLVLIQASF